MLYSLIRPLLFKLDPEKAHELTLTILDRLPDLLFKKIPPTQPISAMGLTFPHLIGLAAGLDKNGEHLDGLAKLGFSFIEIGTVTPKPQEGNPKPRLFRLTKASAIINRMGFNNKGVDCLVENVKKSNYTGILGINIGKNKETSLNHAADDYLDCLKKTYAHASYITINISSPNTPDLRQLQQAEYLMSLLKQLNEERIALSNTYQRWVPLAVKLSPDENIEVIKQMTEIILANQIDGIIATNTTCSREGTQHLPISQESGGLSGEPLFVRSTQVLAQLKEQVGDAITLIGVGGIDSLESAKAKLSAGANLLQLYTGLIYKGADLVFKLAKKVSK